MGGPRNACKKILDLLAGLEPVQFDDRVVGVVRQLFEILRVDHAGGDDGLGPRGAAMFAHALAPAIVVHLHVADELHVGRREDHRLVVDFVQRQDEPRPETIRVDLGRRRLAQEVRVAVAHRVDQPVLAVPDLPTRTHERPSLPSRLSVLAVLS